MSIAEKLTTVAENQQKVYDAGFKKAIDRYCPESTESGAVVEYKPFEGHLLKVVSNIVPIQAGSGDPSPTNVRSLSPYAAVKVTITNGTETAEHTADLGQDVYAGNYDWSTGLLTLTHKMVTFTGEESGWTQHETSLMNTRYFGDAIIGSQRLSGWCSHVPHKAGTTTNDVDDSLIRKASATYGYAYVNDATLWGLPDSTVEGWIAYLKSQAAAGTPLQVVYQLEKAITVQLDSATEIIALSGMNTIQSDTGDTTVAYKCESDWYLRSFTRTFPLSKLYSGYAFASWKSTINDEYKYGQTSTSRTSYLDYIEVEAGATYKFDWEGS